MSAALDAEIATWIGQGYRIESQTGTITVMVAGKRCNHILHLLLSVVTFGLWIPVWICVAAFGGEKRVLISEDADGVFWKHA